MHPDTSPAAASNAESLVRVREVSNRELYFSHPEADRPPSRFVELDCRSRVLTAGYDPDETVPSDVRVGRRRRYAIHNPIVTAEEVNALLCALAPLAARVLEGYLETRERGSISDEGHEIEMEIQNRIARWEAPEPTGPRSAAEWLAGFGDIAAQVAMLGITASTTDDELEEIEANVHGDTFEFGTELVDLAEALQALRNGCRMN